jgi:hypothetical protein
MLGGGDMNEFINKYKHIRFDKALTDQVLLETRNVGRQICSALKKLF